MDSYMFKQFLKDNKAPFKDKVYEMLSNKGSHKEYYDDGYVDKEKLFKMLMSEEEGFNDEEARYIVSQMYHISGGRKHSGEHYDMTKAKEICERYRSIIPSSNTHADVYIAINAQYHDYCELFKAWFGENIDVKVFESAVNFWFKDDDYITENKVYKYFKCM